MCNVVILVLRYSRRESEYKKLIEAAKGCCKIESK